MSASAYVQNAVLDALRRPDAWPGRPAGVEAIETHGAIVFLAGDEVVKVKRAVKLDYLDFSTLEARERVCRRELELNRPNAPGLYLDVVAVRRRGDGSIVIGGEAGEIVEWGVRMRRFSQADLLSSMAVRGTLTTELVKRLADRIVAAHGLAPKAAPAEERIARAAAAVSRGLLHACSQQLQPRAQALRELLDTAVQATAAVRAARARHGHVRRCHGDLHLNNIVLWQGEPMPFDALEFDERLATIDTLYDLAFLVMDIQRKIGRLPANILLNRYLWRTGDPSDLDGLVALPLFLGLRAAVRALVALDKAALGGDVGAEVASHVAGTLDLAIEFLRPPAPQLVAVGGLSGTGKSVLSAALAPSIGAAPGALHLRTDLERKWLAGVGETERLPPEAYTPEAAMATYARVLERARLALAAGHAVVVDGVHAAASERDSLARLAHDLGVPFRGLWLTAAPTTLRTRVAARTGDASDATVEVLERQLATLSGAGEWAQIDAEGSPEDVASRARDVLGVPSE